MFVTSKRCTMSNIQRLTKAEEEVMHYFWTYGPSTVSSIIEQMDEPKPPHSTVSSITRILETKGFLDHKTYGRTHEYFPIVEKSQYSKFSIRKLVSEYFEGSVNDLVSFLVKEEDLSLSDLEEIKKQLKK